MNVFFQCLKDFDSSKVFFCDFSVYQFHAQILTVAKILKLTVTTETGCDCVTKLTWITRRKNRYIICAALSR